MNATDDLRPGDEAAAAPGSSASVDDRPWLAFYEAGVPADVEVPPVTLDELLRRSASRVPDRPALVFYNKVTSYRQLDEAADRFANALRAMGVGKGDRVTLHLPTTPAFVIAYYGTLRAGALVVPVNPMLVPRELAVLLAYTAPKVTVSYDLLVPRLDAIGNDDTPGHPGRMIVTGVQDSLPAPIRYLYPIKARREGHWNPHRHTPERPNLFRLLAESPATPVTSGASPDDPAVLQPTGGTTGIPKAATLTHRNLVANAAQVAAWFPEATQRERTVILCPLPLSHIYGQTVDLNYAVMIGATLLLLPRFEPEQVLRTAARHRPQLFPAAPLMYETLAGHPKIGRYDLSSIEACISGSSALLPDVQLAFEKVTGGHVSEGYGLTEASPVTHCNPLVGDRRIGTIGIPFPSTRARIVDIETGAPVPLGEPGELEVSGPQVMSGYWQSPEETARVLHDGWLRTGDVATRDADGYFRIVDRLKDLIIVGGVNVYPREVEEFLLTHPAVADAAVIGVPDHHYGEKPYAFVVLAPGAAASSEELIEYCRGNMARFKVPCCVEFRESLPKTMIGKVLRKELRAELASREQAPG